MIECSRTTLETTLAENGSAEIDIRFPITRIEVKKGFWHGTMWIVRPKRGKARMFGSEQEAREYAKLVFGQRRVTF